MKGPESQRLSDRARALAGSAFKNRATLRMLNKVRCLSDADRAAIDELVAAGYVVFLGEDPTSPGSEVWRGRARCNDHIDYALKVRGGIELVTITDEASKEKEPLRETEGQKESTDGN